MIRRGFLTVMGGALLTAATGWLHRVTAPKKEKIGGRWQFDKPCFCGLQLEGGSRLAVWVHEFHYWQDLKQNPGGSYAAGDHHVRVTLSHAVLGQTWPDEPPASREDYCDILGDYGMLFGILDRNDGPQMFELFVQNPKLEPAPDGKRRVLISTNGKLKLLGFDRNRPASRQLFG